MAGSVDTTQRFSNANVVIEISLTLLGSGPRGLLPGDLPATSVLHEGHARDRAGERPQQLVHRRVSGAESALGTNVVNEIEPEALVGRCRPPVPRQQMGSGVPLGARAMLTHDE